jgi:hypothetical protein
MPDVKLNNYPARNLDRQIANEPVLEQWVSQARELQQLITDEVIEQAVKQLPAETFSISGNEIISKLKSRRDDLHKYARKYYLFLAKEVEVVGTKGKELFHVTRLADGNTLITLSKINKKGETEDKPFYSRVFLSKETKEVRLYGLSGNDVYHVDGEGGGSIKVRIIAGLDRDSIVDRSESNTVIYDDHQNDIISSKRTKLHLSKDSSIHVFKYDAFKYNDAGFSPKLSYNFEDKLYIGIGYKILRQGWRKEPFKTKHELQANYSISQKNFSFIYKGEFRQVIGKWNINLNANYDLMRWTNFFGLGNETQSNIKTRNYYQVETRDIFVSLSLNRPLGKYANLAFGPVYNSVLVLENKNRFIYQSMPFSEKLYEQKHFAGVQAGLVISGLNDKLLPTKGIYFSASAQYMQNIKESGRQFTRYNTTLHLYVSLLKNLVLVIRPAAATVTGLPEFYQHVSIGGSRSLRGYIRDRFWGTSAFSSAHELQWLFNMRTKLFNGKAGLIALYDVGRVWQKNEISDTWHTGYGGGFLISPFNKIVATVVYGVSTDGGRIHIRVYKGL